MPLFRFRRGIAPAVHAQGNAYLGSMRRTFHAAGVRNSNVAGFENQAPTCHTTVTTGLRFVTVRLQHLGHRVKIDADKRMKLQCNFVGGWWA